MKEKQLISLTLEFFKLKEALSLLKGSMGLLDNCKTMLEEQSDFKKNISLILDETQEELLRITSRSERLKIKNLIYVKKISLSNYIEINKVVILTELLVHYHKNNRRFMIGIMSCKNDAQVKSVLLAQAKFLEEERVRLNNLFDVLSLSLNNE